MQPVRVSRSRTVPVGIEQAYAGTLPLPLTRIFTHWFGPLPPVAQIRAQVGPWAEQGQTRTVVLTGGATMREQLTRLDPPTSFAYRLSALTGPLGLLVEQVDGAWSFTAAGAGTTITWAWAMHPRTRPARPAVTLLGRFWNGYAGRALAVLADELTASTS